ncbi:hypothetical protein WN943_015384 [Citrus x changshan-huyou]
MAWLLVMDKQGHWIRGRHLLSHLGGYGTKSCTTGYGGRVNIGLYFDERKLYTLVYSSLGRLVYNFLHTKHDFKICHVSRKCNQLLVLSGRIFATVNLLSLNRHGYGAEAASNSFELSHFHHLAMGFFLSPLAPVEVLHWLLLLTEAVT